MAKVLIVLATTLLVFLCSSSFSKNNHNLDTNFYRKSCPNLVSIVRDRVDKNVRKDNRMGASLLRMHFHDCFVIGCDGSILLKGQHGERVAPENANSIRGYEVIDEIKSAVEAVCRNTVSCADILALAALESVIFLKGPSWKLEFGRRDAKTSSSGAVKQSHLPSPSDSLDVLANKFSKRGFALDELVALSGAHTIGQAQCTNFRSRIHNDNNIDAGFARNLRKICPAIIGNGSTLQPLDIKTPTVFDNSYYGNLFKQQGLLHSDQELFSGNNGTASLFVYKYWKDLNRFTSEFSAAMLKMSRLSPLLGTEGEIRKICSRPN